MGTPRVLLENTPLPPPGTLISPSHLLSALPPPSLSSLAFASPVAQSDFDGHAKRSFNNIHAYANVYGPKCTGISNLPHAAENDFFAEAYSGNKCILSGDDGYLNLGGGCVPDATLANRIIIGNNTIYTPNASTSVSCGKSYTFPEWVALGLDKGTTVQSLPTADQIITWAKDTLGMW